MGSLDVAAAGRWRKSAFVGGDDLLVRRGSDEKGRMQLTYHDDLVSSTACGLWPTLCVGVHVCASSAASVVQAGSAQHIQHDTPLTCRMARGRTPLMYSMCSSGWDDVFSVHWSVVMGFADCFLFFSFACLPQLCAAACRTPIYCLAVVGWFLIVVGRCACFSRKEGRRPRRE